VNPLVTNQIIYNGDDGERLTHETKITKAFKDISIPLQLKQNVMILIENCSVKPYNTFGIEAKARYFARVSTMDELTEALYHPAVLGLPVLILGGGSNILFTKDFDGFVIKIELKGITVDQQDEGSVWVTGCAGEDWDNFVAWCVERGYAGLENLSLIPGVVGTCPVQNIGAYGVEVKDTIDHLTAFDKLSGKVCILTNEDCHFGYRDSIFKYECKGRYIILSVTFRLLLNPVFHTQYGAIGAELALIGISELTISAIRTAVISIRRRKLPDPHIIGNAGSFFKNPTVAGFLYEKLHQAFPSMVAFELPNGSFKLAAGWLIEQCGWKGYRIGDAGVHAHQALVLVNYGKATGNQILSLANEMQASVKEKFGIVLEMEVNMI
jgi:UDP-N-acetylmuramate dehydrogenase